MLAEHRPALERSRSHALFARKLNGLLKSTGSSHFKYYTDDELYYWHLRSCFGNGGASEHVEHIGVIPQRIGGRWFVRGVLEGSVAASTKIRVGDELVAVNDEPFEPVASFRGRAGKRTLLKLRRRPGLIYNIHITPIKESLYRAMEKANRRSITVVEHDGLSLAYLHGWTLLGGAPEYEHLLDMQDDVDGLLLDYRDGFGGTAQAATGFLLGGDRHGHRSERGGFWRKPVVILIADGTRSAKEIVVDAVKEARRAPLIGTPTPGAVTSVGAVRRVGDDGIIMLPGRRFALEGNPTHPDFYIERDIRFCAGADNQLRFAKDLLTDLIRSNSR